MKSVKKVLLLIALVLTAGVYQSSAQIVIKVRPERPHYERIAAPSPRHVWIDEDWVERGGKYEWAGGHWVEPPREHARWIPGHWVNSPAGWAWKPGRWK